MDGYETARRIRERSHGPAIKIVALTGWGEEATRNRVKEASFDDHVTKPMDLTKLAGSSWSGLRLDSQMDRNSTDFRDENCTL